jgi:hypothetical protein
MPAEIPRAIADATTKIGNLQRQTFRNWTVSTGTKFFLIRLLVSVTDSFGSRSGSRPQSND